MQELVLDVGCGANKEPNAIGLDQYGLANVDVICDLNQSWPIQAQCFDKVIFRHSINHYNDFGKSLMEAARVLKTGGTICIIAPHFSSDNIFTDPTVKFFTGYRSVNYFCSNTNSKYTYYCKKKLMLEHRRIHLYKSEPITSTDKLINKILFPMEFLINKFPRIYEKFFCFILRANEIKFIMRVQ